MKLIPYFYILFNIINKCLNYVVYPLKTIDQLDTIDKFLSMDSTYTTLEIGTPPQKVNFYLTLNHYKMFITNTQCKSNNLFNIEDSKSFNMIGEVYQYEEKEKEKSTNVNVIVVLDTIYFYDNINLSKKLKIEEFPLYFSFDSSKEKQKVCGDIGLSVIQLEKYDKVPEEFEYYLKYLRTQNIYFSFFNYKGDDYIVNSIFLHEEFKDVFYNVKNISWTNSLIRENSLRWEISIKEIFYNKVRFKNKMIFELNPLFELIIGTNEYKEKIKKDFFDFYINKKICSINTVKNYEVFECNSNKLTNKDIQKFPSLYIYNTDLNHIFDLTSKDLFNQLNNKYYFNIVFPTKTNEINNNKWVIGKIFFRKFPVIFCPKNRIIGFYIKPNEGVIDVRDDTEVDKNYFEKNTSYYISIVIVGLVFTCIGLYIGKKLFFPKYKKAKELSDGFYEYNDEGNNHNTKKEIIKNKSYTNIEMNSKLSDK